MTRVFAGLIIAVIVVAAVASAPARAIEPDEVLADPVLEARARAISKDLRCVGCQNMSIDDSDAAAARDMLLTVRERLLAGDTNQQVVAYMAVRYGDYVLLRPPSQTDTLALWIGPPLMAVIIATLALLLLRSYQRRRAGMSGPEPLTRGDRERLDALVEDLAAAADRSTHRRSALRDELDHPFTDREADDGDRDDRSR